MLSHTHRGGSRNFEKGGGAHFGETKRAKRAKRGSRRRQPPWGVKGGRSEKKMNIYTLKSPICSISEHNIHFQRVNHVFNNHFGFTIHITLFPLHLKMETNCPQKDILDLPCLLQYSTWLYMCQNSVFFFCFVCLFVCLFVKNKRQKSFDT